MEKYHLELDSIYNVKSQVKKIIKEHGYKLPCRVIASIKRKKYRTHPVIYNFDFLIEKGELHSMVAHELEHWIVDDSPKLSNRELLKDIPTEELAQILAERLKVPS